MITAAGEHDFESPFEREVSEELTRRATASIASALRPVGSLAS
jgi:hypothetical protein